MIAWRRGTGSEVAAGKRECGVGGDDEKGLCECVLIWYWIANG